MRKRHLPGVLALVVAFAVAIPPTSAGFIKRTKTPYAGTVAPTGTISFSVLVAHIKTKTGAKHTSRAVSNIAFSVPVTCPSGTRTVALNLGRFYNVKLFRRFEAGSAVGSLGAFAIIRGTRTAGTLRVNGIFEGGGNLGNAGNCDSGLLNWTAARS